MDNTILDLLNAYNTCAILENQFQTKEGKKGKGKGKFHPGTGHAGPEGEQTYSSTLSLTSALDGGGWSMLHTDRLAPRKDPVPIVQEAGWAPRSVWMGAENHVPNRTRSPDRPSHSESLY